MAIEGSAVLRGLQKELREASQVVARCEADASALEGQMRDLLTRRGEALVELARHFLPDITRPTIESTFAGIRSDLLAILARKERREAELHDLVTAGEKAAQEHDAAIDDVTKRLNEKVALRERLETEVAETLKKNDDFQQRSTLALQAEEKLHRNEQRVSEIQAESREKLPNYENSRLFRYLYDRGFSTPEYKAEGLTRTLDRWVARLIGFNDARNGYEFLMKTPELVGEEVRRRRELFTELMQQVEAIQKAEADKAGLTAVLEQGEQLGDERDKLVSELEQIRQKAQEFRNELAELGRLQNAFYNEAIERFRSFLGDAKLALIEQRARQTPETADDAIVAELADLDRQMNDLKPRADDLASRREAADSMREGFDQVVRRFRQNNFDSQRSILADGFDLRRALGRYNDGMLDAEGLWDSIRSAQQFRPHWVESTTAGAAEVLASPNGRVLIGAVLNAANEALQSAAYRGMQRRGDVYVPSPSPSPRSYDVPSSPPPTAPASEGGFTTGEGF
jgi:hypothetical protein